MKFNLFEKHIIIMALALCARFFTLYPLEPHLHQKQKSERAWGTRFGHRARNI